MEAQTVYSAILSRERLGRQNECERCLWSGQKKTNKQLKVMILKPICDACVVVVVVVSGGESEKETQ